MDIKKISLQTGVKKIKDKFLKKIFHKEDPRKLNKLVNSNRFDMFIMSIILADAIVLGLMTSEIFSLYFDRGLFLLDSLFMGIFIVEMFIKIYALRKNFFNSGWNIFDLIVVSVSSVPFLSTFIVLRSFRLFRLFKYIHHASEIHNITATFIRLIPTFVSFITINAVIFYAFAIISVSLYGEVFGSFGNLGSAIFTLLQIVTLDGWASAIARPVMLLFPHSWLFFFSLVILFYLTFVSFLATVIREVLTDK